MPEGRRGEEALPTKCPQWVESCHWRDGPVWAEVDGWDLHIMGIHAACELNLPALHVEKTDFTLDEVRTDTCIVRCRDCGHEIGTLAELKERVAEEVFRRSTPAPLHP